MQRDCRNNPCPVGRPHARYFCCGRCAGMHKCRELRMRKSDKSHQNHFAPRLTCEDALMPRAHGCAGAAFARIVSVSGLRHFAFPALACKSRAHHPWRARSAGQRSTGPLSISASPLPGPLTGPCFGCTHPRPTVGDLQGRRKVEQCRSNCRGERPNVLCTVFVL